MLKILITGAAGFIGFHTCKKLLRNNYFVVGFDNLNNYYDTELKKARLKELRNYSTKDNFTFFKGDLENYDSIKNIFNKHEITYVIHLGAQAGVRHSIDHPQSYVGSNLKGFVNILEICKEEKIKHLLYASSSSVYGGNRSFPYKEQDEVSHPLSLYAATKKSNELMAHAYSHLFNIPCTGLRFFTIYGPWGRPDMAPMIFTKAILNKNPITIFNNGDMYRDFTYIDDVVEVISKLIKIPPKPTSSFDRLDPDPSSSWAPYNILNIGNKNPVYLMDFIQILEKEIGYNAIKKFEPMQNGDVQKTIANTNKLNKLINFYPKTDISVGVKKLVDWYKKFYKH